MSESRNYGLIKGISDAEAMVEHIELMLEKLSILQLLGIGGLLAVIVQLTFFRKNFMRAMKEEQEKNLAKRKAWREQIKGIRSRVQKHAKAPKTLIKQKELSSYKAALVTEQWAIQGAIERAVSWLYREWHRLSWWERIIYFVPVSLVSVAIFFFTNFPIVLASNSFKDFNLLFVQANGFMDVLIMYIVIYFLMSRFRFVISVLATIFYIVFVPAMIKIFLIPTMSDAASLSLELNGILYIIAALLTAWVWVKSKSNRPRGIVRLLGLEFIVSGICNTALGIYMMFNVSSLADETSPEQVVSLPIYKFFEPFLQQVMTPLHLKIGDLTPENIILSIIILSWGMLLFILGTYIAIGKYETIAEMPDAVDKIRIYT